MINPVLNIAPPAQGAGQKQNSTPTTDGFGALLARKMDDQAVTDNPPASANSTEGKATKTEKPTEKTDQTIQDQAPDATTNPLTALLLGNQALKTAATASDEAKTNNDQTPSAADTITSPMALPGNPEIKVTGEVNTHSEKSMHSTGSASALQAGITREKIESATLSSARAESVIATQPDSKTGTESFKLAELTASLPTPSAQVMAQSASSQLASGMMPNMATNNAQTTITAPLGSRAWPDEFSQKINWVSTQQNQVAELHLNPPDLGPMSVVLTVSENQATALFTSPHSAVREAIENALPKLRESLAENGIMLGNATVSDQPPRDSGAGNFMSQRTHTRAETANLTATESAAIPLTPARRHNGMIDTFA